MEPFPRELFEPTPRRARFTEKVERTRRLIWQLYLMLVGLCAFGYRAVEESSPRLPAWPGFLLLLAIVGIPALCYELGLRRKRRLLRDGKVSVTPDGMALLHFGDGSDVVPYQNLTGVEIIGGLDRD